MPRHSPYPVRVDGTDGSGVSAPSTLTSQIKNPSQATHDRQTAQRAVIADHQADGSFARSYLRHQKEILRRDGLPVSEQLAGQHLLELENAAALNGIVQASQEDLGRSPDIADGEMQIGLTRLVIPPEKIQVDEQTSHTGYAGLRTQTTSIIHSGRGRIQITLDVPFNGTEMINGTLREILAQFRGYPYVPVISPYLQRIIQTKVQRKIPPDFAARLQKEMATAFSKVGDAKIRVLAHLDVVAALFPDLKTALAADADYQTANIAFSAASTLQDLQSAQENVIRYFNKVAATLPTNLNRSQEARQAVLNFGQDLDHARSAILHLARIQKVEIQAKVGGLVDPLQSIIPCCLDQMSVQSVPGKPHLLRASIGLIYFNPIPYGGILQYRNLLGQPTVDPNQALFARRAMEKWSHTPSGIAPLPSEAHQRLAPGDTFHQEQFHRDLNIIGLGMFPDVPKETGDFQIGYASPTLLHEDPDETKKRLGDGQGSITEHLAAQVPQWHTLKLGNRSGIAIRYISGSLGNRLAIHPVPGEYYGSAQYMGAQPGQAVVFMAITDPDILAEIHSMKYANQRMSTLGVRHWRRPEIHIRNPLLNLMGIWSAQIEDIKTATVSPNTTEVTITLIEHRVDPKSREAITRPLLFSQVTIKRALKFLFKHAQNHIREQREAVQAKLERAEIYVAETARLAALNDELKSQDLGLILPSSIAASNRKFQIKQHQQTAYTLLFGEGAILTSSVVGDAFFTSSKSKTENNPAAAFIKQQVLVRYRLDKFAQGLPSDRLSANIISAWNGQGRVPPEEQERYEKVARSQQALTNFEIDELKRAFSFGFEIYEPTDDDLEWLAAHLVRSGGNVTDKLEISDEEGKVSIKTQDGTDRTADVVSLMTLAQAILHNQVQPPGETGLQELVLGKGTTIQNFLSTIKDSPSFLYADLHLPTYGEALIDLIQAIQIKRTATDNNTLRPIASFDQLSQEERALIGIFVPTFRHIGKIPTKSHKSLDDFAYELNDTVLPDFPFYSRQRTELIEFMEQKSDDKAREGEDRLKKKQSEIEQPPHDPLDQVRTQELFDQNQQSEARPAPTAAGTKIESITFENRDILLTEAYGPARHRAALGDFGTIEKARAIAKAASSQEEDAHLSLRKCFPTLRLFFIEERNRAGTWKAIDDVYGFNSIIEVNVTQHKYRPDLAEIHLNNLEGNLEYDKFSTAQRDTPEGALKHNPRVEGGTEGTRLGTRELSDTSQRERGEQWLQKFPLREGTRILLQLGYHSHPDYLETVFTGKIAEISFGDVIRIVAQSYLAELLIPVVQDVGSETLSGVIEAMMDQPTVEHFGKWTPFSHQGLSRLEMENAENIGFWNVLGSRYKGTQEDWARFLAAPKLRNVFVGRYSSWWSKFLLQTFVEGSWEVGGGQKTAWDVMQEIINYSPGYIVAVRPYDMEATLFVGRPEQPYFWTDGLRDQERDFERENRSIQSTTKAVNEELLKLFLSSKQYHGDILSVDNLLSQLKDDSGKISKTLEDKVFEIAQNFPKWTSILEYTVRTSSKSSLKKGMHSPLGPLGPMFSQSEHDRLFPQKIALEMRIESLSGVSISRILNEILDIVGTSEINKRVIVTLMGTALIPHGDVRKALASVSSSFVIFGEIWDGTEVTQSKVQTIISRQRSALLDVTTPETIEQIIRTLYSHRVSIPVFFKAILEYLKADPLTSFRIRQNVTTRKWPLNPRTKPFRAYHLLSSFEDIIENQIACTRGAMWNGVAIAKGSDTPLTLWADNGIVRDDRILRYFSEPNADIDIFNVGQSETTPLGDFTINKYLVGFSRIAQGLRPMYRGQLVCRGRPDIHPWNICHVFDAYNSIFGPIEVEGVSHHFSSETGFITTITPHCVAIANNHIDSWSVMKQSWQLGGIALGSALGLGALTLLLPFGLVVGAGIAIGVGAGALAAGDSILEEITGAGILGNFHGVGQVGGLRTPVKIIPLQRMGTPWVAALRGWGRDPRKLPGGVFGLVYERLKGAVEDVRGGWNGIFGLEGELQQGFEKSQRFGEPK